jgi:hypothetical protein
VPNAAAVSFPANQTRGNEDAFALGDGVAVVVDGAGLPKKLRRGCNHSVQWYAENLARAFCDKLDRRDSEMSAALASAIADVAASHGAGCRVEEGSPSATVAAWRTDADSVEYLVLCDASIVLAFRDGSVAEVTGDRITRVTEPAIDEYLLAVRRNGGVVTADELRTVRRAAVEQARNRAGGFWCCHVDPAAAFEAIQGRVQRDALHTVVAASDGATRGHQLLGTHTPRDLAAAAGSGDLAAVIESIRRAEDGTDRLVQQGIKRHDDATVAAATFDYL